MKVEQVWEEIQACHNMIFITFQRCSGKGVYFRGVFGHFGVQIGAPRAGMCSATSLDMDEIG